MRTEIIIAHHDIFFVLSFTFANGVILDFAIHTADVTVHCS